MSDPFPNIYALKKLCPYRAYGALTSFLPPAVDRVLFPMDRCSEMVITVLLCWQGGERN